MFLRSFVFVLFLCCWVMETDKDSWSCLLCCLTFVHPPFHRFSLFSVVLFFAPDVLPCLIHPTVKQTEWRRSAETAAGWKKPILWLDRLLHCAASHRDPRVRGQTKGGEPRCEGCFLLPWRADWGPKSEFRFQNWFHGNQEMNIKIGLFILQ